MSSTIKQILNQFGVKLDLPQNLLNLEVEGEYSKHRKDNRLLMFQNGMDYNYFDCHVFEGDVHTLIIALDNDFETIIFRKKLDNRVIGYSLNLLGGISVRT